MGQYLFGKFRDHAGNYVRVEIHRLGVGGDNHEEVTIRSLKGNLNGNPQEPYKPFTSTSGELVLSIHKDKFWQRRLVFDLLNAGDHGFGVHIYISRQDDFDRRSLPKYIGFIDINNLSYDDYPFPYDLTLKFYDGLSSLRDTEFKTEWKPFKAGGIAWTLEVHRMIFDCINCIPNIQELFKNLDAPAVTVNCSWFADNMHLINGNLDNPLEVVAVNPAKWNEVKDGGQLGVFKSAGEVLEALLSRFQLRIYFYGTTYVIEQMSERRNEVVIRHTYKLDGTNFFYPFAPGRGDIHDITIDRIDVHRVARSGFGYFPAAKEVRVNFNYTNDFSWVNAGVMKYDSQGVGNLIPRYVTLIEPKYNYDATGQRVKYRLKIKIRSDYLIPYENYSFSHRYIFAVQVIFGDSLMADHKYNEAYSDINASWGENRWVDPDNLEDYPGINFLIVNPDNPDELIWANQIGQTLGSRPAFHSHPSQVLTKDEWGKWQEVIIEGITAEIPEEYTASNFPVGVTFGLIGIVAQGSGWRTYYEDNINSYFDLPKGVTNELHIQYDPGKPLVFRVRYEVEEFAVWLADSDGNQITDTATRVYTGTVDEKNKKVIEIDTEFGDGTGPLSFSALRVLQDDNSWQLSEGWSYAGLSGDIHELQVKELMRFYGEPRRMLTGKVWLRTAPETVNGPPFIYRFLYDNGIFLPMQVSYDFQTNILEGSLMSVIGEYSGSAEVEVREYQGPDEKLRLGSGRKGLDKRTVDAAAGLGVVRTRKQIGIDSYVNNGATVMVDELAIVPATYGYFNKGDQIQVTDGNTGRQLIFTVEEDVMPDDEVIKVEEQEVDIEIGDNATIMLYQEQFESQAYTDNRRKYAFIGPLASPTDRISIDWKLPDKTIVSTELIRKRMSVHIGSSKSIYLVPTWMGCDIDNDTNELVFNETIPAGEYVEVIYDGVRLEK